MWGDYKEGMTTSNGTRDVSLVIGGEAGQGIQTVEDLLVSALARAGYHVFASKEYMSRVRGGSNSTQIRVAGRPVAAPLDRIDLLIPLSRGAVGWLRERIGPGTLVLADREALGAELDIPGVRVEDLPLGRLAAAAGSALFQGVVAAGAVAALFRVDPSLLEKYLGKRFAAKDEEVVRKNIDALGKGYAAGVVLRDAGTPAFDLAPREVSAGEILLDGGEAVALGALAGGCDFIAAYPMTPSTSVLTFLARRAREFGVVVEQAEDEIAAVNMALGAWYAGARALVSTSGGGFDLMAEGLSLAGMHESPLVIHLGQRPGPATGLPTRTEQADLELALYAGHGEFPRVILAPGTAEQAFDHTRRAFDLADRFQVPVFILTDQHLVDSRRNVPAPDVSGIAPERRVVATDADYRRYRVTDDGISPRGIPGRGDGIVVAGSDEHEEDGSITELRATRRAMVDKRLRKRQAILRAALPPEYIGWRPTPGSYHSRIALNLVVCWGSTRNAVLEAVESLGRDDIGVLHCPQVFPPHPDIVDYLHQASKLVFVEGNATGQFSRVLRAVTGWMPRGGAQVRGPRSLGGDEGGPQSLDLVLKYDGSPFTVEEVAGRLKEILK
jgi:2-oxoglutarate ferredoxin oxidoreductase subunit alpha